MAGYRYRSSSKIAGKYHRTRDWITYEAANKRANKIYRQERDAELRLELSIQRAAERESLACSARAARRAAVELRKRQQREEQAQRDREIVSRNRERERRGETPVSPTLRRAGELYRRRRAEAL